MRNKQTKKETEMKNNKKENKPNFNEGITLGFGGEKYEGYKGRIKWLVHNNQTIEKQTFVKVSNLTYDTTNYKEGREYYYKGKGLKTQINPDDLVSEWIGIVLNENGIEKVLLKDWLERYRGGLDVINDDIRMIEPMEVVDFDYEIIPFDEIVKQFPLLKEEN